MKYMINRVFGLRGVLTLLALMLAFAAAAQNKITGKVVDENNQPAIGANVVVKGTTQGVSTDLKGTFTIPVKKGDVLVFSYLGYKPQEVTIAAQTRLDITLVPEANVMDEVVVVGYGAMKRGDLTGSVASVSSKDVEGFKTGSVMEALGGQIAGVQITATDGTPGAGFDIKVRGIGSVNGDTSPPLHRRRVPGRQHRLPLQFGHRVDRGAQGCLFVGHLRFACGQRRGDGDDQIR